MRYIVSENRGDIEHGCCHEAVILDTEKLDGSIARLVGEFPDKEVAKMVCRMLNCKQEADEFRAAKKQPWREMGPLYWVPISPEGRGRSSR